MASVNTNRSERLDRALARVLAEIHTGLKHGYFDFLLTGEIIGQGRRRLTLRAGKNYQFVIPAADCESGDGSLGDLRHGGAGIHDEDATYPGDREHATGSIGD